MRTEKGDEDKEHEAAKEIILETIKAYLPWTALVLVGAILLIILLTGSVSVYQKDQGYISLPIAEFVDPRIISITSTSGQILRNPIAGYDSSNAACADLSSRYNQAKTLFCSARMKADLTEARASHEWFLTHYKIEYYNFTSEFQNMNASATLWKAQAYERRWIKVYDDLLAGCELLEAKR